MVERVLFQDLRDNYNNTCAKSESGGVLLGLRRGGALQITKATFPSQWDLATPTRFHRSHKGHRISALKEWTKSGGTVDWIGKWHTHPHSSATPSYIDLDNWRSLTKRAGKPLCFVIMGARDIFVGLQDAGSPTVRRCVQIEEDDRFLLFA